MTTIPNRYQQKIFWNQLDHLKNQVISFEKLFVCIPKQYKRFSNENKFLPDYEKYPWIDIISMEIDHGPACKYLGPLMYRYDEIQNNILIIIDDDRYYDVRLCELYLHFFNQHVDVNIASGNPELYYNIYFYNNIQSNFLDIRISNYKYVSGFMSWSICMRIDWLSLIDYTLLILNQINDSFYHDEGILINYLWYNKITVYYINFKFINMIHHEHPEALCLSNSYTQRKQIEYNIYTYSKILYPSVNIPFSSIHPSLRYRRRNVLGS